MTHGDKLHKIMKVTKPAVAGAVSNGLAQAGFTVKHRLHGAVLGKGAVPGGAVPVHLAVKVVAIQFLCSRLEIVGVVAGPSRRRNQSQYFRRDGIYRDGGLVRKGRASGAVRVSCVRVINDRPCAGKVSGAKRRSRHGYKAGAAVVAFIGPVVASEEEQLVLLNGATESAAEVIEDALALLWAYARSLKELSCPEGLILMVLESNSVELIAA